MVPDRAIGLDLEQGRPLAATGSLRRLAHRAPDGEHVVAIHRDAGDAIGRCAGRHLGVQGHRAQRRGGGVKVVLADQDDGCALEAGEVARLVEGAMIDGAVAEEGDRDAIGAAIARAERCSDSGWRPCADEAVGAEQSDRAVVDVHGAAAPAGGAVAPPVQLGHQRVRRDALGQRMAVPAMGAGDPVGRPQMRADADRARLLADIEMQEARRLACPAGDLRRQLKPAQQHHLLIQAQHRRGIETLRQRRMIAASVSRGAAWATLVILPRGGPALTTLHGRKADFIILHDASPGWSMAQGVATPTVRWARGGNAGRSTGAGRAGDRRGAWHRPGDRGSAGARGRVGHLQRCRCGGS